MSFKMSGQLVWMDDKDVVKSPQIKRLGIKSAKTHKTVEKILIM